MRHCSPLHALRSRETVDKDVLARNRLELLLRGHAVVRVPVALGVAHRVDVHLARLRLFLGRANAARAAARAGGDLPLAPEGVRLELGALVLRFAGVLDLLGTRERGA